jgi:hypothetical protein
VSPAVFYVACLAWCLLVWLAVVWVVASLLAVAS